MSHLLHPAANLEGDELEDPLPPEIEFDEAQQVTALDLHPCRNLLAAGLTDGRVSMQSFKIGSAKIVNDTKMHKGSCRFVAFTPSGDSLYSVANDRSIRGMDVKTEQMVYDNTRSEHRNSINCMKFVAEQTFYTGDDAGYIKMWDLRKSLIKPVHTMRDNVDQITCLEADDHSRRVFATSLDGCMTIIDVRSKKKDPIEDVIGPMKKNELTCVAVLDRGMHVTVGTSKGTIFVWKHGAWRAPRTSIKGHPEDIHCFLKASEQHILTGSADGAIRYLRILPENERSFDKLVAHHKEQDLDVDVDFGIEAMRFNFNKRWLAYISHDSCIHWADVSKLEDPDSFVCQSEPRVKGAKRVAKARKKKKGSEPEAPAEVSASVVVPWYLANGDDAVDGGGDNTANTDSIGTSGGCTGGGAGDGDGDGDASSQEDSNSDAGAAAPPPKKEKKKRKKVFSDDDSDASSEAEKPKKSKKKAAKVLHMGKPTSVRRMFFASL